MLTLQYRKRFHYKLGGIQLSQTFNVEWSWIKDFVTKVFVAYGIPEDDAAICTDVLLASDKKGIESHGVNRFKPIYLDRLRDGIQSPVTNFEIIRETATTAVVDGHDGMGQVIGTKAMQMAIDKAKEFGMGMVAVRNSTHYGIAGYYTDMAAKAGCIGMTGTNARPSIAPTFGVENMLGTNPLTLGFPTDEEFPFNLDCATSISQRGKIEYFARVGQDTPEGMVIGRDGSAMTDSPAILEALVNGEAALAPLGGIGEELAGYKGYGFATFVEVLSAALQQGNFLRMLSGISETGEKQKFHLGHFFIAIDTEAFVGLESFKKTAGDILRELRASELAPGEERIYTAGEKEFLIWQERKETGLPLNEGVQKELIAIRDDLGWTEKLPFE
ncbi:Ldh family oxidoreductase [Aerococcaceae bacterium WS4759]|uniref:Ldh family oxidoreductase n=1 Tax=Fundicoccus ignavus TaxID=2664442 RepID=A0A6I2GBV8_9LACT|nr:Ldh family oxidoreductase [Fundicoccus ignavus]